MSGLLNNGYANHAVELVRFAPDLDRKAGEVVYSHLTPDEIAEVFARAEKRYKNEPPMKRPIIPMPLHPRLHKPNKRSEEELDIIRHTYIELRSQDEFRTHIVPIIFKEFQMGHHEFYKCLRLWRYDDRSVEDKDIESFKNGLF